MARGHSRVWDHDNRNDPTAAQKAALVGTSGTASSSNPYVTFASLSAYASATHASTHYFGGSDPLLFLNNLNIGSGASIQESKLALNFATHSATHASTHYFGGSDPLLFLNNLNIGSGASIQESKLALNFPTHSNANDPTSAEKSALDNASGYSGPASSTNMFVTDSDIRLNSLGLIWATSLGFNLP